MKDISKRLISAAAALALVISACIPGLVFNRISAEEFSEQSFYIDYSEFDISQNHALPNPNRLADTLADRAVKVSRSSLRRG